MRIEALDACEDDTEILMITTHRDKAIKKFKLCGAVLLSDAADDTKAATGGEE
jgi:hypothetical protein